MTYALSAIRYGRHIGRNLAETGSVYLQSRIYKRVSTESRAIEHKAAARHRSSATSLAAVAKRTGLLQELLNMAIELLVRKVELGDNPACVLCETHCEDSRRWWRECEVRQSWADEVLLDGELRGQ
jgi:hypothetical protein